MEKRKPVLIFDDSSDSAKAIGLLRKNGIEFVEYDVSKFVESCCCGGDDLPTTKAPSVFAPEGVFKGLDGVKEYITITTAVSSREEASVLEKKDSESAYW